jgi:tetratricopeptide (TPR) repeat protein
MPMATRQQLGHVDNAKSVGRRVKAARVAAGLSQRELSFPGCTPAYVSRIEKGDRVPSLQILREFAARLGVTESFLARGGDEESFDSVVVEARAALRVGDMTAAHERIDSAVSRAKTDAERAIVYALEGEMHLYESDAAASVEALEKAVRLSPNLERTDPTVAEALGRAYARQNEYEAAIGVFLRNYQRAREQNDLLERVRFGALLANAYADTANFVRAEEILGDLVSKDETVVEPLARARVLWAQSRLHALKHDTVSAARYARHALEILRVSDQTYYVALAHQLLAHIELDRGNGAEAMKLLDEAAPLIEASGRPFENASLQIERARAFMKLGQKKKAAGIAMGASAVLEKASPLDAGRGYALIAQVFADLGDTDRAIELYELAIERLEVVPTRYLVDSYSRLAELLERKGDPDRALALLRRAMNVQQGAGRLLVERAPTT